MTTLDPSYHTGWLLQQKDSPTLIPHTKGETSHWKRRYYVVKDDVLFVYYNPNESTPHAEIPLRDAVLKRHTIVDKKTKQTNNTTQHFVFSLTTVSDSVSTLSLTSGTSSGQHTYYFQAQFQEEMDEWIRALSRGIDYANQKFNRLRGTRLNGGDDKKHRFVAKKDYGGKADRTHQSGDHHHKDDGNGDVKQYHHFLDQGAMVQYLTDSHLVPSSLSYYYQRGWGHNINTDQGLSLWRTDQSLMSNTNSFAPLYHFQSKPTTHWRTRTPNVTAACAHNRYDYALVAGGMSSNFIDFVEFKHLSTLKRTDADFEYYNDSFIDEESELDENAKNDDGDSSSDLSDLEDPDFESHTSRGGTALNSKLASPGKSSITTTANRRGSIFDGILSGGKNKEVKKTQPAPQVTEQSIQPLFSTTFRGFRQIDLYKNSTWSTQPYNQIFNQYPLPNVQIKTTHCYKVPDASRGGKKDKDSLSKPDYYRKKPVVTSIATGVSWVREVAAVATSDELIHIYETPFGGKHSYYNHPKQQQYQASLRDRGVLDDDRLAFDDYGNDQINPQIEPHIYSGGYENDVFLNTPKYKHTIAAPLLNSANPYPLLSDYVDYSLSGVAICPKQSNTLLSISHSTMSLFDLNAPEAPVSSSEVSSVPITSYAWSTADEKRNIGFGSAHGAVKILDTRVLFSKAAGTRDNAIRFLDRNTFHQPIVAIANCPTLPTLWATCTLGGTLAVWDERFSLGPLLEFNVPSSTITSLTWSSSHADWLHAGFADGTVSSFNLRTPPYFHAHSAQVSKDPILMIAPSKTVSMSCLTVDQGGNSGFLHYKPNFVDKFVWGGKPPELYDVQVEEKMQSAKNRLSQVGLGDNNNTTAGDSADVDDGGDLENSRRSLEDFYKSYKNKKTNEKKPDSRIIVSKQRGDEEEREDAWLQPYLCTGRKNPMAAAATTTTAAAAITTTTTTAGLVQGPANRPGKDDPTPTKTTTGVQISLDEDDDIVHDEDKNGSLLIKISKHAERLITRLMYIRDWSGVYNALCIVLDVLLQHREFDYAAAIIRRVSTRRSKEYVAANNYWFNSFLINEVGSQTETANPFILTINPHNAPTDFTKDQANKLQAIRNPGQQTQQQPPQPPPGSKSPSLEPKRKPSLFGANSVDSSPSFAPLNSGSFDRSGSVLQSHLHALDFRDRLEKDKDFKLSQTSPRNTKINLDTLPIFNAQINPYNHLVDPKKNSPPNLDTSNLLGGPALSTGNLTHVEREENAFESLTTKEKMAFALNQKTLSFYNKDNDLDLTLPQDSYLYGLKTIQIKFILLLHFITTYSPHLQSAALTQPVPTHDKRLEFLKLKLMLNRFYQKHQWLQTVEFKGQLRTHLTSSGELLTGQERYNRLIEQKQHQLLLQQIKGREDDEKHKKSGKPSAEDEQAGLELLTQQAGWENTQATDADREMFASNMDGRQLQIAGQGGLAQYNPLKLMAGGIVGTANLFAAGGNLLWQGLKSGGSFLGLTAKQKNTLHTAFQSSQSRFYSLRPVLDADMLNKAVLSVLVYDHVAAIDLAIVVAQALSAANQFALFNTLATALLNPTVYYTNTEAVNHGVDGAKIMFQNKVIEASRSNKYRCKHCGLSYGLLGVQLNHSRRRKHMDDGNNSQDFFPLPKADYYNTPTAPEASGASPSSVYRMSGAQKSTNTAKSYYTTNNDPDSTSYSHTPGYGGGHDGHGASPSQQPIYFTTPQPVPPFALDSDDGSDMDDDDHGLVRQRVRLPGQTGRETTAGQQHQQLTGGLTPKNNNEHSTSASSQLNHQQKREQLLKPQQPVQTGQKNAPLVEPPKFFNPANEMKGDFQSLVTKMKHKADQSKLEASANQSMITTTGGGGGLTKTTQIVPGHFEAIVPTQAHNQNFVHPQIKLTTAAFVDRHLKNPRFVMEQLELLRRYFKVVRDSELEQYDKDKWQKMKKEGKKNEDKKAKEDQPDTGYPDDASTRDSSRDSTILILTPQIIKEYAQDVNNNEAYLLPYLPGWTKLPLWNPYRRLFYTFDCSTCRCQQKKNGLDGHGGAGGGASGSLAAASSSTTTQVSSKKIIKEYRSDGVREIIVDIPDATTTTTTSNSSTITEGSKKGKKFKIDPTLESHDYYDMELDPLYRGLSDGQLCIDRMLERGCTPVLDVVLQHPRSYLQAPSLPKLTIAAAHEIIKFTGKDAFLPGKDQQPPNICSVILLHVYLQSRFFLGHYDLLVSYGAQISSSYTGLPSARSTDLFLNALFPQCCEEWERLCQRDKKDPFNIAPLLTGASSILTVVLGSPVLPTLILKNLPGLFRRLEGSLREVLEGIATSPNYVPNTMSLEDKKSTLTKHTAKDVTKDENLRKAKITEAVSRANIFISRIREQVGDRAGLLAVHGCSSSYEQLINTLQQFITQYNKQI